MEYVPTLQLFTSLFPPWFNPSTQGCIFAQNRLFLPHPFFSKVIFFPQSTVKIYPFSCSSTSSPLNLRFFIVNHHIFSPSQVIHYILRNEKYTPLRSTTDLKHMDYHTAKILNIKLDTNKICVIFFLFLEQRHETKILTIIGNVRN